MKRTTFTGPRHLRRGKRARHRKALKRQLREVKARMAELNGDGKIRGVRLPSKVNTYGVLICYGPVMQLTDWKEEVRWSTVVISSR